MKFSHKLSDAVHLLAYIEIFPDDDLSSRAIARSIVTNPSMVRSLMMDLRKAGFLKTKQGSAEPELAKKPEEISLYDVFAAVGMEHHLLHVDEDTEQKCPVGGNIQGPLAKACAEVEEAAFAKMREISLREIVDQIKEEGQLA
ncbi:Rrf2 family transcriptional regulator [Lactobacillus delbrueckii]|uniref:Rrf2 family transcriptional regulator n=1 Tax=Lactobacillus delbrueckii TaxID=1584 RepID=UPI000E5A0818|nr:Rrf2 family transcriptional regulator [Lactobacillus delbrueckii]RHX65172.1 transcriptional regulator [Lactobacillus delbrueckii]